MPGAIDGVRLAEDAETAYTADYGWHTPVMKGAALAVVGLVIATVLVLMLRRYRATPRCPESPLVVHDVPGGPPAQRRTPHPREHANHA
ncbi:hypothetical protein NKH18_12635 [Streptomyces sp. M10(2022)]